MHCLFARYDSPLGHQQFRKLVGDMEIPYEGRIRKGHSRPYYSEFRLGEVRCLEETVPRFLRNINASMMTEFGGYHINKLTKTKQKSNSVHHGINYLIILPIKIIRLLFRFVTPEREPGRPEKTFHKGCSTWFIGAKRDPRQVTEINMEPKEVL